MLSSMFYFSMIEKKTKSTKQDGLASPGPLLHGILQSQETIMCNLMSP